MKKTPVAVRITPDGREICNLLAKEGRDEYQRRKLAMWERQGRRCGLQIADICNQRQGRWPKDEIQFDHANGRTSGKQDDRIEVMKNGTSIWQNATVCPWCNSLKGSRRVPYLFTASNAKMG